MITKLPRWVEYGAFTLAFLAGNVNVVAILGFKHQSVAHLSGTATLLGIQLADFNVHSLHLVGILVSFMCGSALSGFFLSSSTLKIGRHYDTMLGLEGLLLATSVFFLNDQEFIGHYLASMACGLQNGLATTYSNAIIRTTHLTGIITDIGLLLGARLKGNPWDKRQLSLQLLIVAGFVSGAAAGSVIFPYFHYMTLYIPATIAFVIALAYRRYYVKNAEKDFMNIQ